MQKRTKPALDSLESRRWQVEIEQCVERDWPRETWSGVTVVVAVSGGADSVALLRALCGLSSGPGRLMVAHYNHRWRDESDEEARFVQRLAGSLGLDSLLGAAPRRPRVMDETRARRARYGFFRRAADQLGARYVATGHTADDQVETVLLRLLRGTGVRGLAGIPRTRRLSEATALVRPLLAVPRATVREYLVELGQTWHEDASNDDPGHLRNRVRHHLLPLLERDYQPAMRARLVALAAQAQALEQFIAQCVEGQLDRSCHRHVAGRMTRMEFFPDQPLHLRCEMLRQVWREHGWPLQAMGHRQWTRLAQAQGRSEVTQTLPGNVSVHYDGQLLHLERREVARPASRPVTSPAPPHLR